MSIKDKIANLLFLYLLLCVIVTIGVFLSLCDASCVSNNRCYYVLFGIVYFITTGASIYFIVKMTERDYFNFIRELNDGKHRKYKYFTEYRKLRHAFEVMKNESQVYIYENEKLKEFVDYLKEKKKKVYYDIRAIKVQQGEVERSIESLEMNFIGISNNLSDFVFVTDNKGIITYANNHLVNKVPSLSVGDHVSGVIKLNEEDCSYFHSTDFINVEIRMWDQGNRKFSLSTKRVMNMSEHNNVLYLVKNGAEKKQNSDMIKRNQDFYFINEIFEELGKYDIFSEDIQDFLDKICIYGNFAAASIRVINNETKQLDLYLHHELDDFVINNESAVINNTHMGMSYISQSPIFINSIEDMHLDELSVINAVKKGYHIAYFPLRLQDANMGVLTIVASEEMSKDMIQIIKSVCINLTIALEKIMLYDELRKTLFGIIDTCANTILMGSAQAQSLRIAKICRLIAQKLYYKQDEVDLLYSTVLLKNIDRQNETEEEQNSKDSKTSFGVYQEFIDIAREFDEVFSETLEIEVAKQFLKNSQETKRYKNINLINVLEYIINNDFEEILDIYGVIHA